MATAMATGMVMATGTGMVMATAMVMETATAMAMATGMGTSTRLRRSKTRYGTCSMRRTGGLAIVTISLTACGATGSDVSAFRVCPPVIDYGADFREQAAGELASLPEGSAIAGMLADYAVMREQARACGRAATRPAGSGGG